MAWKDKMRFYLGKHLGKQRIFFLGVHMSTFVRSFFLLIKCEFLFFFSCPFADLIILFQEELF